MFFCKLVEFLINILPSRGFQDFLVRRHVITCSRCKGRLISREVALQLLSGEKDVEEDPLFVRAVKKRASEGALLEEPRRPRVRLFAQWAASVAGLMFVVASLLWLSRSRGDNHSRLETDEGEKFRINYLNVDGAPAEALVIQPRDSDMVIIWVDRSFGSPDRNGEPGGRP